MGEHSKQLKNKMFLETTENILNVYCLDTIDIYILEELCLLMSFAQHKLCIQMKHLIILHMGFLLFVIKYSKLEESHSHNEILIGYTSKVRSLALANNCNHVLAGCQDNMVYLYNFRTTELLDVFNGHTSSVTDIRISKDQSLIFTASEVVTIEI